MQIKKQANKINPSKQTNPTEPNMFYIYLTHYGFTIDLLTSAKATFEDHMFARNFGYCNTKEEAQQRINAAYP